MRARARVHTMHPIPHCRLTRPPQVKLAGTTVVCPLSGCATVLDSAYASLYGVPLSLLGMMAYGAVGACAVAAQLQPDSSRRSLDTALAAGTALLAGVSGYLM